MSRLLSRQIFDKLKDITWEKALYPTDSMPTIDHPFIPILCYSTLASTPYTQSLTNLQPECIWYVRETRASRVTGKICKLPHRPGLWCCETAALPTLIFGQSSVPSSLFQDLPLSSSAVQRIEEDARGYYGNCRLFLRWGSCGLTG